MKKILFKSLLFSIAALVALVTSPVLDDSSETNALEAQSPSLVAGQPSLAKQHLIRQVKLQLVKNL